MKKFFTKSEPVVALHHARVLVELAVAQGVEREAILEGVGIAPALLEDPDARISYDQLSQLERNALSLTGDPTLALRWGRSIYVTQTGLMGLAAITSSTLGAAFQIVDQYFRLISPGWEIELRVEGRSGFISFRTTIERGDLRVFATEAVVSGFYNIVLQARGRPLQIKEARLDYPKPAHHGSYPMFLSAERFVFDCPVTEAEFDAAILDEPLVTAEPAIAAVVAQLCAVQAAQGAPSAGVAAQVRKVLIDRGSRRTSIDHVARVLQTSDRSLRRALRQVGTTYQEIADDVLRARAQEWVRSGSAKVEHIARELGFTDARSFRRAFKRWTGHAPNDFRRGSAE